jgi:hypothetical protein
MIIATSGDSYINYNRIISSSASAYLVSSNETYRDPAYSYTRYLYGLYIIDKDNSVSLIYDISSGFTDLASINFAAPSISFQRAFPTIWGSMQTAVFTSPTVYYAGGHNSGFYTGLTTPPD